MLALHRCSVFPSRSISSHSAYLKVRGPKSRSEDPDRGTSREFALPSGEALGGQVTQLATTNRAHSKTTRRS